MARALGEGRGREGSPRCATIDDVYDKPDEWKIHGSKFNAFSRQLCVKSIYDFDKIVHRSLILRRKEAIKKAKFVNFAARGCTSSDNSTPFAIETRPVFVFPPREINRDCARNI